LSTNIILACIYARTKILTSFALLSVREEKALIMLKPEETTKEEGRGGRRTRRS